MRTFKQKEKARRYAMQALYTWQVSKSPISEIEAYYLADRNPKKYDVEYFLKLFHEISRDPDPLEGSLAPFVSRKLAEITPIELTILWIATYEFTYCPDIPYRVIINEALELAKCFGAEDAHKFVNGVLDKMAKKLRAKEIAAE